MEPSDYAFSEELTDLLRRWYLAWAATAEFEIRPVSAAPTQENRAALALLTRQAIAVIRREAPSDVQVQTD